MEARQIWNYAGPTTSTLTSIRAHCTPFTLPSNGVLSLAPSSVITLATNAVFEPECTAGPNDIVISNTGTPTKFADFRDPFYASTIPQCYALAAATVIAYMLVIMLLITPRTFLHQGAVVLGRRGFTNGPSGSDAGIGIGGRPWLQKVAALTVAISLTIATADTFKVAEQQYNKGVMDALTLQRQVEDGNELKIIRVISDTFLWLAQAQTLIRLFPRQREKIIIKWTAFALITLDVFFSILNNFVYSGNSRPRTFVDAVPALAYLFQLALSLLYCAWVIYYSITKKQFAFYHPQMRNICLVALLSLVAVLVPVVFFVLDISKPTLASWGDYVRWVGAAAASVVVWEWVERIEALERNDKRDGVLGREVFDGDEMLDITPSSDSAPRQGKRKDDEKGGGGIATGSHGLTWPAISGIAHRYRPRATQDAEAGNARSHDEAKNAAANIPKNLPPLWPTRPLPAATPVSRTDTASAESTVYAIRYHPISDTTPPILSVGRPQTISRSNSLEISRSRSIHNEHTQESEKMKVVEQKIEGEDPAQKEHHGPWQVFAKVNILRRNAQQPPVEVSAYTVKPLQTVNDHGSSHRWALRSRIEDFAATQADKFRDKARAAPVTEPLPITIIPAPPRRRNIAATLEELEVADRSQRSRANSRGIQPSTHQPMTHGDTESVYRVPSSDPNSHKNLNRHSITQRGNISFVDSVQQGRLQAEDESPGNIRGNSLPVILQSSVSQPHSPTTAYRNGLPILSIPPPPRRPRSEEE